jgi:hypothetical protein
MILSRDQNYKVGDLVNNTSVAFHMNEQAIVLRVHENDGFFYCNGSTYSRCLIEYQHSLTVEGRKVQSWVSAKDLRYDLQFLRDKKIKAILE